jgi:hypothetical protein
LGVLHATDTDAVVAERMNLLRVTGLSLPGLRGRDDRFKG